MRIENSRIAVRRVDTPMLSRSSSVPSVVAQPINMYVPTDLSLNSDVQRAGQNARIGGLLKELAGNTVRIAGAKYQENVKEDTLRGMQDANERLEMDSSRVSGFLHSEEAYKRGYRATEDEARAVDLKAQFLEQLRASNYFVDDPNPRARIDALYKDTYKSVFNEEYMNSNERNGMMSESGILMAKNALLAGEEEYNKAYIQDRRNKLLNSTGTLINHYVDTMYDKGTLNPASFQETMNSISIQTRQSEGGDYISPNELASFVVSRAGDKVLDDITLGNFKRADATLYALRNLRDVDGTLLYDKVVDSNSKTGVLSMPYKDIINNLEAQSIKAKEEYRKEQEALLKKAQEKNAANLWVRIFSNDLLDPASKTKQANEMPFAVASMIKSGQINAEDGARLMKASVSLSQNAGFAETSNTEVYTRLLMKNQGGRLTFEDVEANKANLTKVDYSSLLKGIGDTETGLKSIGMGSGTAEWKSFTYLKEALENRVGKPMLDTLNQKMQGDATKALQLINKESTRFLERAQQEGKKVTISDINNFFDELTAKVINEDSGLINPEYIGKKTTQKDKVDAGSKRPITSGKYDDLKSTTKGEGGELDKDFFNK
jgi:hypothetical protein|nr:MAG TPA: hypothetical protein [Caudoviricetes sp.]